MSITISKHLNRAAELLSLICYTAKYHRSLGWPCVYDVKFRQKAATKSVKLSVIDSTRYYFIA